MVVNMNATDNKNYEDKRVVVLDGNNRKLDVSDGLEMSDNYRRPITDKSKMRLTICDYTNKDKGGSITAKFNFTPQEIAEFDYIMRMNGDFTKKFDRIFNLPDDKGLSPVKRIQISRQSVRPDGSASKYPIYICIENGRARCNVNPKGMTSFSNSTYKQEQRVDIRLSYEDGRTLFRESAEYIERIKTIYAMEIRAKSGNTTKEDSDSSSECLSEKKYVDGVNSLYKAIAEQLENQNKMFDSEFRTIGEMVGNLLNENQELRKEIENVKNEVMFGR